MSFLNSPMIEAIALKQIKKIFAEQNISEAKVFFNEAGELQFLPLHNGAKYASPQELSELEHKYLCLRNEYFKLIEKTNTK